MLWPTTCSTQMNYTIFCFYLFNLIFKKKRIIQSEYGLESKVSNENMGKLVYKIHNTIQGCLKQ